MFDLANQEHWVVKMVEVEESVPHESRNQIGIAFACPSGWKVLYSVVVFFTVVHFLVMPYILSPCQGRFA